MWPGFDSRLMPPSFFSNVACFIVKLRRHGDSNPCAQSSFLATRTHRVFAVLDSHQNVVLRNCASLFISNFSVLRPTLFWVVIRFVSSVALTCIWARLPGSRSEFLLLRRVFVGYLYMFHWEFSRWRELLGMLAEIPKSQHALRTKRRKSCHSLLWNILGCSCMIWTLWPSGQGVGLLSRWGLPAWVPIPQVSIFFFRCSQACRWVDKKIDSGDWKQCEAFECTRSSAKHSHARFQAFF